MKYKEYTEAKKEVSISQKLFDEIKAQEKALRSMSKHDLTKEQGSRLDLSSSSSEPKDVLVRGALDAKFGESKVRAYYAKRITND